MTLDKVKKYLTARISELKDELDIKIKTSDTFPKSYSDIKLEEYGSIDYLRRKYNQKGTFNIIRRIFGPDKTTIKKEILQDLKNEYSREIKELEDQIKELEQATKSIKANEFILSIIPGKYLIKEIIVMIENKTLTVEEGIKTLIKLFKVNKNKSSSIENKIMSNLADFYDEDNNIIKSAKLNTVILLFEKVFYLLLSTKEQSKLYVTTTAIINQIKVEYEQQVNKGELSKEELQKRKDSLEALSEYYNQEKIVKTPDSLDEFRNLLAQSGLEKEVTNRLSLQMLDHMDLKEQQEEIRQIENTINKILGDNEKRYIEEARTILKENEQSELVELLRRIYNDTISICKYIPLTEGTNEYESALERLTDKIRELKLVINRYKNPSQEFKKNNIYFATDHNMVPIIMHTIEGLDINHHDEVLTLLYSLVNNEKQRRLQFKKDKIDFFIIGNEHFSLIYAKKKNEIVIVNIIRTYELKSVEQTITKQEISSIQEVFSSKKNESYQALHDTYENLVLDSLQLNQHSDNLSLSKLKKD